MNSLEPIDVAKRAKNLSKAVFSNAIIHIKNLRLRTYIGFNQEELVKQQDIIVNADIVFDGRKPSLSDNEHETLNYKLLTKSLIAHVESGQFRLIEKLNADLLNIIMANDKVLKATVTIDKPHALRFADSVAVTLSAERAS